MHAFMGFEGGLLFVQFKNKKEINIKRMIEVLTVFQRILSGIF
jgi:hypothetical protein